MTRQVSVGAIAAWAAIGAASFGFAGAPTTESEDAPTTYVVRARAIYTGTDGSGATPALFEPGMLLVEDGRITAVGEDLEVPGGVPVHDFSDQVLMPGVVMASSTLAGSASAPESVAAHQQAADAFDPYGNYRNVLMGGVTTAYLSTGRDRLISGRGAVAKLSGPEGAARLIARDAHLEINLVSSALRPPSLLEIPIPPSSDNPIKPSVPQLPTNEVGQLIALREAVAAVRADASGLPAEALRKALDAKHPVRIVAQSAAQLRRALRAATELGHPTTLVGVTQGLDVEEELAKAGHAVVVELDLSMGRASNRDAVVSDPETAAGLAAHGLSVALCSVSGQNPRDILLIGALGMRGGMSRTDAVGALTRVPAEVLGVNGRVGTLEPGKDADFLVLSDVPFARSSHVQKVMVDGAPAASRFADDEDADAPAVVLRGGTIMTGDGQVISDGSLLLQDGKIAAVGAHVAIPPGARVVELADDAVVTPGFIDCSSRLELGGDSSAFTMDLDLTRLVASPGDASLDVARAGVTTALVQTPAPRNNATRVMAVKTAGHGRDDRVVSDVAAIKYTWRSGADPQATAGSIQRTLDAGKKYHESWIKYGEALAKWEEEQSKKSDEEKLKAEAEAKKKEAEVEEEVSTEKKVDPVTGKWELQVSGGPIPEPIDATMNLQLEGDAVTGTFVGLFGGPDDGAAVEGTYADGQLTLKIEAEGAPFEISLTAMLDGDSISGSLAIGDQFNLDVAGTRTEKTFEEVTVVKRRKKSDASGKPEPPAFNAALEPYRALFGGESQVTLEIDQALQIRAAAELFKKYELPLILVNADQLPRVLDEVRETVKGVVVRRGLVGFERSGEPTVPAQDFASAGLPVAFQTEGGSAAQALPASVAYAVRQGLDPNVGLAALTSDAAKLFGLEERVGSLRAGLDGDVLVFSGDPFDLTSELTHVFVNGEAVDMEDDS